MCKVILEVLVIFGTYTYKKIHVLCLKNDSLESENIAVVQEDILAHKSTAHVLFFYYSVQEFNNCIKNELSHFPKNNLFKGKSMRNI